MQERVNVDVEDVLMRLDEAGELFPGFQLKKENDALKLLGQGSFSCVYEMTACPCEDGGRYALKVLGFDERRMPADIFEHTCKMQWILCQESPHIVQVLAYKQVVVAEETLQCMLMEALSPVLEKDRFGRVSLRREELQQEAEVLRFGLQMAVAMQKAHENKVLHRDIKLENVFWDAREEVYKLGDFGAAKYAEDGYAQTIIYTDGYGAPEIRQRLQERYDATADIYALGMTMYLLLNDLRFPGSDGYHPRLEVQYAGDAVLPAPLHASEALARVLRTMCRYRAEERYQSMEEVLLALCELCKAHPKIDAAEFAFLEDLPTETYREPAPREKRRHATENFTHARMERKENLWKLRWYFRRQTLLYFVCFVLVQTCMFMGLQTEVGMAKHGTFWLIPMGLVFVAIFQKLRELHLFFGTIALVGVVVSMYMLGVSCMHLVWISCVLLGWPMLTMAGAVSSFLWVLCSIGGQTVVHAFCSRFWIGWVMAVALVFVVIRYGLLRRGALAYEQELLTEQVREDEDKDALDA